MLTRRRYDIPQHHQKVSSVLLFIVCTVNPRLFDVMGWSFSSGFVRES